MSGICCQVCELKCDDVDVRGMDAPREISARNIRIKCSTLLVLANQKFFSINDVNFLLNQYTY